MLKMWEWRARETEEKDSVGTAERNNKKTNNNGEKSGWGTERVLGVSVRLR